MGLGSNNMTVTTGANFIPELWGAFIEATEALLVHWGKTWDVTESEKGVGDIIHLPALSNLTANTKTAGSEVTLNGPTEGVTNLTIDQHKECSFLIEDILKVQSQYNLMDAYKRKASYAISKVMDTSINDRVASFSQIVGVAGTDLGDQDIRDAHELLDIADAPEDDRCQIIHPTQKNALFGIEKYFRADFRGDGSSKPLVKRKFGEIYGTPVYSTTQVGSSGGARLNTIMHREAIASAVGRGMRVQGDYIQEYLAYLVTVDVLYGSVEARDDHGVWMKS